MSQIWTHRLRNAAGGLSLARESGHTLTWDSRSWLVLLNRRGELQGQIHLESPLLGGAISDDGSAVVVADERGQISWFAPDFTQRWRTMLARRPTAIAIDSLGRGIAVADAGHQLHFFDATGRPTLAPVETVRPLVHLSFATSSATLMVAADFGLIGAIDHLGRWLWQDAPVVHLGSISCSGDSRILAAGCFSDGIRRFDPAGRALAALPTPEPCRLVALTFDGQFAMAASAFGAVFASDNLGKICWRHSDPQPVVGFGLAPLGDRLVLAHTDGRIVGLDVGKALR